VLSIACLPTTQPLHVGLGYRHPLLYNTYLGLLGKDSPASLVVRLAVMFGIEMN
jgi:hypothetical protein